MAKSKNHTAHNQSYKAHKNGIKKPKRNRQTSTKGVRASSPAVPPSYTGVARSVYLLELVSLFESFS
jgi:hypothetical protein